ncbi:hypothetical protein C8R43DRAFT_1118435 [Mycena crocata]|nr:hypothetical protein C8R43DRAFT_1118435 [Mycena crocata]
MANATLDELLKRNRAPNEAEIHVIHEERRKVEEEIVRLAGMLLGMDSSAAQTVNNELNARRKIHLELLESLRSVESVVRTCPADVWLEVFKQLCVAAGHDWTRQILRVTAVCRGWRGVAVGAPSLWKVLNIAGNGWADEEDMETLNDMLTRSRGSALHVTVGPEPSTPTATWANQHKSSLCDAGRRRSVLDKLLAHANRIEAMAVKLHPFAIYYVALPASVTLPRLRSASIRTVGADREDDIGDMLAWLEQACSLERLAIGVPFKIPRLTSSAIGWAKLAALDLSVPMELSDAMTILARCTALQECRLHRVTEERSAAHLPTRLTLPKLCLLDFGLQTGCCAAFFDLVVCPALTDLTVRSCVLEMDQLLGFCERSHMNPRIIKLSAIWGFERVPPFISLFPGLETLDLSTLDCNKGKWERGSDEIMEYLGQESAEAVLPSLHTLHLSVDVYKKVHNGLIKALRALLRPNSEVAPFPRLLNIELKLNIKQLHLPALYASYVANGGPARPVQSRSASSPVSSSLTAAAIQRPVEASSRHDPELDRHLRETLAITVELMTTQPGPMCFRVVWVSKKKGHRRLLPSVRISACKPLQLLDERAFVHIFRVIIQPILVFVKIRPF